MKPRPLPVDPNAHLPAAVRRASEQADQLHAAHVAPPTPDAPPADPASVTPPAEVVVTPEGNPDAPINWEHRYKSMEGRFKASERNLLDLSRQLSDTQALLSQVPVAQAPTPAADVPAELRAENFLRPEEITEYGQEFLDVVGRKAKSELLPELASVKQQLKQISNMLEGNAKVTKASARSMMHTALDGALPEWKEINVAPEFHSWLALPDDFSGAIRHDLLKTAYEQNNAPRVLAFFNGFLAHEAALSPAITAEPDHQAQPEKIPLETLAAPGRAKTAAGGNPPVEKPTFTHAQIATFYTDVNRGAYRGRDDEKVRLEQAIFAAQRDGRIR